MNTSINSLKIEQFLQQFSHKEALLRKHRNAINALLKANIETNFDILFSKDPRKLSRKQEIDIQDQAEQVIKKFVIYLENNNLSATTITNYLSSIKNLFEYFHIELSQSAWKQIKSLRTHNGTTFHTMTPTKEEIKTILSMSDALEKAFILTMLTTGKREQELLNIELEDLHLNEQPPRINIQTRNTTTKRRTPFAYITEECKDALESYMKLRDTYFLKRIEKSNLKTIDKQKIIETNSNKLFHISDRTIRAHWNDLLNKTGFNEFCKNGNKKRHTFNLYSLRYFFRTYLENPDLAEYLLGHTNISNKYFNKQEHEIKEDYLLYSKNLYIYSNPTLPQEIREEFEGVKEITQERVKILEKKLEALVTYIQQSTTYDREAPAPFSLYHTYKDGKRIDYDMDKKDREIKPISKSKQNIINDCYKDDIEWELFQEEYDKEHPEDLKLDEQEYWSKVWTAYEKTKQKK